MLLSADVPPSRLEFDNIQNDTRRLRKVVAVGSRSREELRSSLAPVLPFTIGGVVVSGVRLRRVTVAGFRGFSSESRFELNGDAVVISGANGTGKTSLIEAVFWCLTGVPLGDPARLPNLYARETPPRVLLEMVDHDGEVLTVTRCHGDQAAEVSVRHRGQYYGTGPEAEAYLRWLLWPPSQYSSDPQQSFRRFLDLCVLLTRDGDVRLPISDQEEASLYELMSELTSATLYGRVGSVSGMCRLAEERSQEIFDAFGSHPAFPTVRILKRPDSEPPRVRVAVARSIVGGVVDPEVVLSHSQTKRLALSVFLGLNLSAPGGLGVVMLDEPMRGMDDIYKLGFCDVLRRLRSKRQVVVSAHDKRASNLLQRKMFSGEAERALSIEMGAWDRSGPTWTSRELDRYPEGFTIGERRDQRVVATA